MQLPSFYFQCLQWISFLYFQTSLHNIIGMWNFCPAEELPTNQPYELTVWCNPKKKIQSDVGWYFAHIVVYVLSMGINHDVLRRTRHQNSVASFNPKGCFSFGVSCVDGVCNCCIYIEPQMILANTYILSIVCVQSSGVKVGIIGGDWGGDFRKKRNTIIATF